MAIKHAHKPSVDEFMDEATIHQTLSDMEDDTMLDTGPIAVKCDDGSTRIVTFSEKHLGYLKMHPKVNPQNYLANIRTMIRIRL